MNSLLKFTFGVFITLGVSWLAFVVGARSQFGDLMPSPQAFDENGNIPEDLEIGLFNKTFI